MSSEKIVHVTDGDFANSVLESSTPVLVDYWADWCGPCKAIAPALDQLADEYDGRVVIAKLNIDDNPQIPMQYAVRGIPTLMLFVNGEVAATKVGAASKAELASFLDEHVA